MRIADQNRTGVVDEIVDVVEGRVAGAAASWSDLRTEFPLLRLLMRLSGRGRRESARRSDGRRGGCGLGPSRGSAHGWDRETLAVPGAGLLPEVPHGAARTGFAEYFVALAHEILPHRHRIAETDGK